MVVGLCVCVGGSLLEPNTDIRYALPCMNQIYKVNLTKKWKGSPGLPTRALLAEGADGLEFRFDPLEDVPSVKGLGH